jgi:hypothetical protein
MINGQWVQGVQKLTFNANLDSPSLCSMEFIPLSEFYKDSDVERNQLLSEFKNKFEIHSSGQSHNTHLLLNDKMLSGISSINLIADVNNGVNINIELINRDLERSTVKVHELPDYKK